jgi:hypothetical protein
MTQPCTAAEGEATAGVDRRRVEHGVVIVLSLFVLPTFDGRARGKGAVGVSMDSQRVLWGRTLGRVSKLCPPTIETPRVRVTRRNIVLFIAEMNARVDETANL